MKTFPCRSCSKPIGFVKPYRGPVDVEPVMVVADTSVGLSSFVVAGKGVVQARRATKDRFGNFEVGARPAFVSHFGTCQFAAQHRKPRFDPSPRPKPSPAPAPTTRDLFPARAPSPERDS